MTVGNADSVSVVIDTFNHGAYVGRAIQSALDQQVSSDKEILVVDDGSTDSTEQIVKAFGSSIRYLRKSNGGQASAFNLGIEESRGNVVAFLDGDDYWLPGKLAAVLDIFATREDICAVGHGITIGELDGRQVPLVPEQEFEINLTMNGGVSSYQASRALLGSSRFAARRQVLLAMLPIPEQLVIEADEWCSALAVAMGKVKVLRGPYTFYRLHERNLYQTRDGSTDVLRRRAAALLTLTQLLPPKLMSLGLARSVAMDMVEPFWVDGKQCQLSVDGGSRAELLQVERRRTRRYSPGHATRRYSTFRLAASGLALLLGPKHYYRLRKWFVDSGLNLRFAKVLLAKANVTKSSTAN